MGYQAISIFTLLSQVIIMPLIVYPYLEVQLNNNNFHTNYFDTFYMIEIQKLLRLHHNSVLLDYYLLVLHTFHRNMDISFYLHIFQYGTEFLFFSFQSLPYVSIIPYWRANVNTIY